MYSLQIVLWCKKLKFDWIDSKVERWTSLGWLRRFVSFKECPQWGNDAFTRGTRQTASIWSFKFSCNPTCIQRVRKTHWVKILKFLQFDQIKAIRYRTTKMTRWKCDCKMFNIHFTILDDLALLHCTTSFFVLTRYVSCTPLNIGMWFCGYRGRSKNSEKKKMVTSTKMCPKYKNSSFDTRSYTDEIGGRNSHQLPKFVHPGESTRRLPRSTRLREALVHEICFITRSSRKIKLVCFTRKNPPG